MKTISELDKSPMPSIKRFQASASPFPGERKQETKQKPLMKIIDLDVPLDEQYPLSTSGFQTGEPGVGRNRDIIGARSTNYVSYQILGRLF